MKRINVEQNTDEWLDYRRGKVSGTRLGDLYSPRGNRKVGFYEMFAEMVQPDREAGDRMQRGLDLEDEAAEALCKEFGIDPKEMVSDGICVSDVDPRIINSPDKLFKKKWAEWPRS